MAFVRVLRADCRQQQKASRHSASAPSQHRQRTSTEEETSELRFGAAHPHANVTTASAALTVATSSRRTAFFFLRGRWRSSGAYRRPVPRRKLKISRRMCGSRPTLQYKHSDMDIAMPMEEIGRWSRREAGLLSSQKQEIQVCERTRPNKKYPGLGPCSESRPSSNGSPRYFLFALVRSQTWISCF